MHILHPSVTDRRPHDAWRPDEFGLRRALLLACAFVAAGVAAVAVLLDRVAVPAPPPPATVTFVGAAPLPRVEAAVPAVTPPLTAQSEPDVSEPPPPSEARMTLPQDPVLAVAAPELSERVPPDGPVPAVVPEPANPIPLPSRPVPLSSSPAGPRPAAPPRPAPSRPRPVRHVLSAKSEAPGGALKDAIVAPAEPQAETATVSQSDLRPAVPDTMSGLGAYRAGLHAQIARNMAADEEVRRLGVTGTAVIEAVIAPGGEVLSAAVARGSGTRAIDRAALAAIRRGGYHPFGPHMPAGPITISVPITVSGD